jgi:hypothetical protein
MIILLIFIFQSGTLSQAGERGIQIDGKPAYILEDVDDGIGGKTSVLVYGQQEFSEQLDDTKKEREVHRTIIFKPKTDVIQNLEIPEEPIPDPNIPLEKQKSYLKERKEYELLINKRKEENQSSE